MLQWPKARGVKSNMCPLSIKGSQRIESIEDSCIWCRLFLLFVFSMVGPKQNAGSLLTPVCDTVFYALSHGTLGFALHGSYLNHFLDTLTYTINWNLPCSLHGNKIIK